MGGCRNKSTALHTKMLLDATHNYSHPCCSELRPVDQRPDYTAKLTDLFMRRLPSINTMTQIAVIDIEEQRTQQLADLLTEHTWLTEEIMDAEDRGKDASNDRLALRLIGEQVEALRAA